MLQIVEAFALRGLEAARHRPDYHAGEGYDLKSVDCVTTFRADDGEGLGEALAGGVGVKKCSAAAVCAADEGVRGWWIV